MSGMGSVLQLTNPTVVAAVWQLASGAARWEQAQVINVAIPYGSSG